MDKHLLCRRALQNTDSLHLFDAVFISQQGPQFSWTHEAFIKQIASGQTWVLANKTRLYCLANFSGGSFGEWDLTLALTAYKYQGQGLMKKLLSELFANELKGAQVTLEVHPMNIAALNLYKFLNFKHIGQRKAYYKDGEKAFLMQYGP